MVGVNEVSLAAGRGVELLVLVGQFVVASGGRSGLVTWWRRMDG
jgi:hypothetical protein